MGNFSFKPMGAYNFINFIPPEVKKNKMEKCLKNLKRENTGGKRN